MQMFNQLSDASEEWHQSWHSEVDIAPSLAHTSTADYESCESHTQCNWQYSLVLMLSLFVGFPLLFFSYRFDIQYYRSIIGFPRIRPPISPY